jgi:hypothetical protein
MVAQAASDWIRSRLPAGSETWLAIVFAGWLLIMGVAVLKPTDVAAMRWLAGSAGFSKDRRWLLGFLVPFLPALYYGFGSWSDPLHAGHWAIAVVFCVSLMFLALTKPLQSRAGPVIEGQEHKPPPVVDPWPDRMEQQGVQLTPIKGFPASAQPARKVPAELERVVHDVLHAQASDDRTAMLMLPDHCGQEESIAAAAAEIALRGSEITLAITPQDDAALAASLRRLTNVAVETIDPRSKSFERADIWVTTAETLSDFLLQHLREAAHVPSRESVPALNRIGLVVWFDVHRYSGVKAANLWAISRRLHRLLQSYGRSGVRTVVFSRLFEASAQSPAFIEHLLPYVYRRERELQIPVQPASAIEMYTSPQGLETVAVASVRTGWKTAVDGRGGAVESVVTRTQIDGRLLDEWLVPSPAFASARVLAISAGDLLSLPQMLAGGGRAVEAAPVHYVALLPPDNPYAAFVLNEYMEGGRMPGAPLLVGAEGNPQVIRRHVQLALREVSDTMAGLRSSLRWEESLLRNTLLDLERLGRLNRRAVRFLDENGSLRSDYLYSSLQADESKRRPLETVGSRLLEVRDPDVAEGEGLRMAIDPERAAIDAYSRRIFFYKGQRYRVAEWSPRENRAWLACEREELDVRTWRGREMSLSRLRKISGEVFSRGVKRYSVSAEYKEEVLRVVERTPDGRLRLFDLDRPLTARFETRCLLLESTTEAPDAETLHVAAMGLRHVLPVHVAVDDDFLEVVPVDGARLDDGHRAYGLAIVELVPGGLGLIDAMREEEALIQTMMDRTWLWLSHAQANRATAESLFRLSPIAAATGGVYGLSLANAIRLLDQMRGPGERRN